MPLSLQVSSFLMLIKLLLLLLQKWFWWLTQISHNIHVDRGVELSGIRAIPDSSTVEGLGTVLLPIHYIPYGN